MLSSLALVLTLLCQADDPSELLTIAERSGFRATSRHADVVSLMDELAARSPYAVRAEMGRTHEDRTIPLLIFSDPPVTDAASATALARKEGRVVCLVFGNIHAGEVCGKEALLMLARELALEPEREDLALFLQRLILVLAPIYNADGNERVAPDNRPGQIGPADGMGQRPNAQGLDLNRDYVKLESKEARAMVAFLNAWNPHLIIDTHTTNGSLHRYHLTYAPPLNPSGPRMPLRAVRDKMLPEVSRRLEDRTGYRTFLYGNFADDHAEWRTYSPLPRFGAQYHGLRGHLSILSEAYAYIPFEERVLVTREFVRECLTYAVEKRHALRLAVRTGSKLVSSNTPHSVGIRHEPAAAEEPATILGWVEHEDEAGRAVASDEPRDYVVRHFDRFVPSRSVPRPFAYLVPPRLDRVIENLKLHGVELVTLAEVEARHPRPSVAEAVTAEFDKIVAIERAEEPFQGHYLTSLDVTRRESMIWDRSLEWTVVLTGQPLGNLVTYLLEPESEDGLVTWNLLDEHLELGADYPILRIPVWPQ